MKNLVLNLARTILKIEIEKYLGTVFVKSGSFLHVRKHVTEQAKKNMYLLSMRIKTFDVPTDLQLTLFDKTILPIVTYGCDWFFFLFFLFEDLKFEAIQNQFLRFLTHLRKRTPLYMVLGEVGRFPLEIIFKSRMVGFRSKILTNKQSKLSYLYRKHIETPNFN